MHRKLSALLLATVIMILTMAGNASAQINYDVTNNSPVAIDVVLSGFCPGPPPILWVSPKTLLPGETHRFIIPLPPCTWSIGVNGVTYPLGYNGPITPPNPPTTIIVGATRTEVF